MDAALLEVNAHINLILAGSHPFEIEDETAQCKKELPVSDHEIDLQVRPQIANSDKPSTKICDLCLQSRPAEICWSCYDCVLQGPLAQGCVDICLRCLQHGRWCRDVSHRLSDSAESTKNWQWKATHVIVSVDFSTVEPVVKTIFQDKLASQISREPSIKCGA
jgi:hypothetical protein